MTHQPPSNPLEKPEPIAIVGMGCRLPGGVEGPEPFWRALCAGADAVTEVPPDRWSADAFFGKGRFRTYSRWGGFLEDIRSFDAGFFGLSVAEAEQMDPQQRLLLETAWNALEDAGLPLDRRQPSPIGVFVGASTHDYADIQFDTQELCAAGAFTATGGAQSILSNRISYCLNLSGPSFTVDTACSSSLVALHLAVQSLRAGECQAALVGGVNCLITPNNFVAFSSLSALSHDGRCKSFDASGDGFVRAEGVGVVVLKRLADAVAAGDRIYATVLASGLNQDGRTAGIAMPNGAAQETLVRDTWQAAGIDPASVCYVEAHGTGTAVGDPVECRALGAVAARGRPSDAPCLLGSVKSNLGHLESGAGVVGLMKLALVLHHREAPPSLHFNTPNPAIDFEGLRLRVVTRQEPLPVLLRETDGAPRYLGAVNSFGFGGANAHAVLSSFPDGVAVAEPEGPAPRNPVLLLSATSEEALRELARRYVERLKSQDLEDPLALNRLCQAAASRRAHLSKRLALLAPAGEAGRSILLERLTAWEAGEEAPQVFVGEASDPLPSEVVFVYSGQGPQWWAMGRQFWEQEPRFREVIEACDEHLRDLADWSLVQELLRDEGSSRLNETAIAQPAIFALQAGITELLRAWGLPPAAAVGHSVGEAAAAWAAGALTLRQGIRLMFHRGRSMAVAHGRGTLLALGIDEAEARAAVAPHPDRLALAAVNAPRSVTLAGERGLLQKLQESYEATGVFARFVPVEYPFHSPFMDPAREGLLASLADLQPAVPALPLYSTVTAAAVTEASLGAAYWWRNVREPVRFAPTVQAMIRHGYRVFLEISAHPALVHSVRECLDAENASGLALPTLRRDGLDGTNLAGAQALLHCRGVVVDWAAYLGGRGRVEQGLPGYPWQRRRYWRESPQTAVSLRYRRPHPFLWRRLTTPDPTWELVLDPVHHAYLNHHVVNGRAIFPGAGYLEGALALAAETLPQGQNRILEEVRFEAMLPLGSGDLVPRLHLQGLDKGARFAIFSRSGDPAEANWTRHAAGRMRVGGTTPNACDLVALQQRFGDGVPPERLYEMLRTAGLEYGPAFRVIRQVWRGDGEALCRLRLPPAALVAGERYHFHPALLDGCLQALFAALLPAGATAADAASGALAAYVPVAVERMVMIPAAAGDQVWALVRRVERTPRSLRCDIEVFGPQGEGLLRMQGCTLKALRGKGAKGPGEPWAEAWYHVDWLEAPRAAGQAREPVALSLTAALPQAKVSAPEHREAKALTRLEAGLRQVLEASPKEMPFLQEMASLANFQRDAISSRNGISRPETPSVPQDWAALIRGYPDHFPEIDLWRRLTRLPAALAAEASALDLLLANGAAATLEHYDSASVTWGALNRGLAEVLGRLLRQYPEGRRPRVLELGARTGALAVELMRLGGLGSGVEYQVCDPSAAVIPLAERALKGGANVSCTPWSGLETRPFDLVVLRDPLTLTPEVLNRLKELVVPAGYLLVADPPRRSAVATLLERRLRGVPASAAEAADWQTELQRQGFRLKRARRGDIHWILARAPAARGGTKSVPQEGRRSWWLVHVGDPPLAPRIERELKRSGDTVRGMPIESFLALPDLAKQIQGATGVLFLASGGGAQDQVDASPNAADAAETRGRQLLRLLQTLGDGERLAAAPSITLITQGAFAVGRVLSACAPDQTALAGLARVAMSELPALSCRVVDLSPQPDRAEIRQLVRELAAADGEEQVALRHEARYLPRVDHAPEPSLRTQVAADDPGYRSRLWSARPGVLDRLHLFREERQPPGPGEVEIQVRAAGLNFRDVMKALGIYPTDAGDENILGDECAGVVRSLGTGVKGLRPGDRVMAIAPGCFGGSVVTRAALVLPLPRGWSFAEGATVLVVYLTAYYALFRLGRLRAGERVLIHAGAGGVGLAAIHLAQRAGAEVFATAGSDSKRALLQDLGVRHLYSSRTLDFADQIRAATQGEGVDLVLNSLAGEAIHQGLSLLRPYGRFLEIGKRDIYEHGRLDLSPFRHALSYFAIDLARMMASGEAGEILEEMRHLFAQGGIRPLPYRAFPITEAAEAFRFMAEARHVGKIVLSVPEAPLPATLPSPLPGLGCRADRSYLITGGLRGFGLASAEWLASRGARKLFLLSRSGEPDPEGAPVIERMRAQGVQVETLAVDVGSAAELASALETARRTAPIAGVIHAAAVYADEMLLKCSLDAFSRVFRAKALGGWNLHRLTREDPIELFILYSSISALIGNPGQASYVAANAFLEGLAQSRQAQGLPALAVGWDRIADTGYVARNQRLGEYMDRMGFGGLTTAEALAALEQALSHEIAGQLVITQVAWGQWLQNNRFLSRSARFERLRGSEEALLGDAEAESGWLKMLLDLDEARRRPVLLGQLRGLLGRMLAVSAESLDPTKPLDQLGLDSLTLVELVSTLEGRLGIALPSGPLASAGGGRPMTLEGLADILLTLLQAQMGREQEGPAPPADGSAAHLARLMADSELPQTLQFPRGETAPGPILLTGASGFLGGYLLAELLQQTAEPIYALLRCETPQAGQERIRQNLERYGLKIEAPLLERVHPLPGDVSRERLGLSPERYAELAGTVGAIYHNAAVINHLVPYERLKPTNVDGVLEILRLAATGRPKHLHYTSTVAVFAPDPDGREARVIDDGRLLEGPEGLLGGYAESKWVAERLVFAARERGLRTTIYRPGLLIGDNRSGVSSHHDLLWRIVQASVAIETAPGLDFPLPLARVDFVAAAIIELALRTDSAGGIFHLVGKPEITLRQLMDQVARLGRPARFVSPLEWMQAVEQHSEATGVKAILPYLHLLPEELLLSVIKGGGVRFATHEGDRRLTSRTLALSPPAPDALEKSLNYLDQTGYFV